jgi:hypothetical protein
MRALWLRLARAAQLQTRLDRQDKVTQTGSISFAMPWKRERFLNSGKGQPKSRREPYHFNDLDPAYAVPPSGGNDSIDGLVNDPQRRGTDETFHLMSARRYLGGTNGSLNEIVHRAVTPAAETIISCASGQLAYDEGEAPHNQFISDIRVSRPGIARSAP